MQFPRAQIRPSSSVLMVESTQTSVSAPVTIKVLTPVHLCLDKDYWAGFRLSAMRSLPTYRPLHPF
jgi:hypothetical protein